MSYKRIISCGGEKYTVRYDVENLNIHVQDSHKTRDRDDVKTLLDKITSPECKEWKEIVAAGYTRTLKSMENEWCAHNVLYAWGMAKARTGSVDMDQKETSGRKFIYAILGSFYK